MNLQLDRERRKSRRIPVFLPVVARQGPQEVAGFCMNVSASGMSLRLERSLEPGSQVELELTLPGGATLSADGEVLHWEDESGGRVGIRFGTLHPTALAALHDLIARKG